MEEVEEVMVMCVVVENKEALHHMMETMLPTGRIIGFWRNLGQSLNKRI